MDRNWELFLLPYEQGVKELKIKLRGLRKHFHAMKLHRSVEFVTGRVKPVNSIIAKAELRHIPIDKLETEMEDIAGLRIMCPFVEDIDDVVNILKNRPDMEVITEKDYVLNEKESGYRSYHIVCKYPVHLVDETKDILVEIQVRTLAMNFWASIEHSLNYKYDGEYPEEINRRLQKAAESTYKLDEEMSEIRKAIMNAEHERTSNQDQL